MSEKTPLHKAARKGDVILAKKLIAKGAKVDEVWTDGITPLVLAVDEGRLDMVVYLLEAGANPNVTQLSTGETLLHDAAYRGFTPILQLLLEKGLDPNAKAKNQRLPLHDACSGDVTATSCMELLKVTKNLNAQDADGYTPLICAAQHMNIPAALLLVQAGADKTLLNVYGETAQERAQNSLDAFRLPSGKIPDKYNVEQRYLEEVIRIVG